MTQMRPMRDSCLQNALPVRPEFPEFPITGDNKDETGDEKETWRHQPVDEVQNAKPLGFLEARYQKSVEDVHLDHHDRGPTPQEIDEDKTVLHSRCIPLFFWWIDT